jgi:hypothetical protein
MQQDGSDVDAIVVAADLEQLKVRLPKGVRIRHEYGLIGGLAVTASPEALRALSQMPVVRSIEPDREVRHQ